MNGLNILKLIILLSNFIFGYKYQSKKAFEIHEDFITIYDYALEKTSKNWTNRGNIEFRSKNSNKNYRSNAFAISKQYTEEEKEEMELECKKNGLVIIRVKLPHNNLIASTKAVNI